MKKRYKNAIELFAKSLQIEIEWDRQYCTVIYNGQIIRNLFISSFVSDNICYFRITPKNFYRLFKLLSIKTRFQLFQSMFQSHHSLNDDTKYVYY